MSFVQVQTRGREFLDHEGARRHWWWRYLSRITVLTTGIFVKCFVKLVMTEVHVENLDVLKAAKKQSELENRGLVTYMNHVSLMDDPFIWSILPSSNFLNPDNIRWSLGADNVCFENRLLGKICSLGQVLPTARFGTGPFQGSIDAAIALLSGYNPSQRAGPKSNFPAEYFIRYPTNTSAQDEGLVDKSDFVPGHYTHHADSKGTSKKNPFKSNWVHIFPEAFVHQVYPPHERTLRYFKWGIGRILLESTRPPIVVPIHACGFDEVVPEDRGQGYNILKQFGKSKLKVIIGSPINNQDLATFRKKWVQLIGKKSDIETATTAVKYTSWKQAICNKMFKMKWFQSADKNEESICHYECNDPNVIQLVSGDVGPELREGEEAAELRGELSNYLRNQMEKLRILSGLEPESLNFQSVDFWKPETGGCRDVPVMGNVNKLECHKNMNLPSVTSIKKGGTGVEEKEQIITVSKPIKFTMPII